MGFDMHLLRALKDQLEQEGYANDEQDFGLRRGSFGSHAFEHRKDELVEALRGIGFNETLVSGGRFYDGYGALHWIYDPNLLEHEEAEAKSRLWVAARRET